VTKAFQFGRQFRAARPEVLDKGTLQRPDEAGVVQQRAACRREKSEFGGGQQIGLLGLSEGTQMGVQEVGLPVTQACDPPGEVGEWIGKRPSQVPPE
jgi:hypothetical protein